MASVPFDLGNDEKPGRSGELPLFRFGLRQLLFSFALASALLAVLVSSRGQAGAVVLLAVIVVLMHVFATALGTRLQARAENQRVHRRIVTPPNSEIEVRVSEHAAKLQAINAAPRSPWHGRGCTYLPWLPRLVMGSMLTGGLLGGIFLSGAFGSRASFEGIVVGSASFAVLGGWISFLGGNFYGVFRHGFRDALAEQKRDHANR